MPSPWLLGALSLLAGDLEVRPLPDPASGAAAAYPTLASGPADDIRERADQALYRAKHNGRNQVAFA